MAKKKSIPETVATAAAKGAVQRIRRRSTKAARKNPARRAPAAAPRPRRRRVVRRNPSSVMRSNPPLTEDLVDQVLPGFAGYGATRFLARIVYSVIVKKKPNLAPHAAALASVIAAAGVWLSVHRIRRLEQYHTPATVGSAIAALQTLLQTYLKKYGWITGDYAPDAIVPGPQLQLPIARTSPTKTITIGGRKYAMPTSPARGSAVDYTQAPLPPPDIGADALSADELDGVSGVAEADLGVFNSQFAVADDDLDQMIAEAANHQIN